MFTVEATESWLANTAAITSTLRGLGAHWVTVASSTLVLWTGSQGVPKEACFALVAVDTCCIVDALETSACQAVTVPGGTGVHIVVALTGLTGPHWATFPEGVPEVAISTELAAGTWKKQMATPSGPYRQQEQRLRPNVHQPQERAPGARGVCSSLQRVGALDPSSPAPSLPASQPDGRGKARSGATCPGLLRRMGSPFRLTGREV